MLPGILLVFGLLAFPTPVQDVPDGVGDVLYGRKIRRGLFGDHFGRAVDVIGDIDDDGVPDLVVGASHSNDGGEERGSVWILRMNADLTVKDDQKISQIYGGLTSMLEDGGQFGKSVSGIGDLDGDGVEDIAVGASRADRLYILFLQSDGRVKSETVIHNPTSHFAYDQTAIPDRDGNGTNELLISDGEHTVYLYYMNPDGSVKSFQPYDYEDSGDWYGIGMETLDDMDGDGFPEIAIGDTGYGPNIDGWGQGGVHLSFMGAGGTQKRSVLLADGQPNLDLGIIESYPNFGRDIALLSDLDGNGVRDIAIGCSECRQPGEAVNTGAVFIVYLNADGTAKDWSRIGRTTGNLGFPIGAYAEFGISCAPIGDWNGDGTVDLAVGARFDDGTGSLYLLMLNDGSIVPPVASGSADVRAGPAPLSVTFTDSSTGSIDSWFWEFGDGYSSTEPSPIHVYREAGIYDVVLTVSGPGGVTDTRTFPAVIDVAPPLIPMGEFHATPTAGLAPMDVTFTDLSLGVVTSWSWSFGDGQGSSLASPTHTYASPGTYTASLALNGPHGTDTVSSTIVAHPPLAPVAAFEASPTAGIFPLEVEFIDRSDGYVESWQWHFGDGSTSSEAEPTHTYTSAGAYAVSLTVTNPIGFDTHTEFGYVVVSAPPPPVADFSANATSGYPTFEVTFEDLSTGDANSWRWDFGDGTRGTLRNPVHRYTEPGFYTVSLIAAGPGGFTEETKTDFIYVAPILDVVESITGGSTTADDYVRGFQFQVTEPRTIVQLGIHDGNADGVLNNTAATPVGLWSSDGTLLAQTTVSIQEEAQDGVFYSPIPPTDLEPGTSYIVACQVTSGGEPFTYNATGTLRSGFVWEGRRRTPGTSFVFPGEFVAVDPTNDAEYFGPELRFDDGPRLTLTDVNVVENQGTVTITASLASPAPWPVSLRLEGRDGSAIAGQDYAGFQETLVIAAGATDATLAITLLDDSLSEPMEFFEVIVTELSGATGAQETSLVTITSDEVPPVGPQVLALTNVATSSSNSMRGNQFSVSEPVTVDALGVFDANFDGVLNNSGDTRVGLWTESGTLLAEASVPSDAPLENGAFFATIAPVTLQAGTEYVVAALLSSGGEPYARNGSVILDPRFTLEGDRLQSSTSTFQFPATQGSANPVSDAEFFGGVLRVYLPDCDQDGIPDELDTGDPDCNGNGIPDTCESFPDCNGNGIPDECEPDCDNDGLPDDCDPCAPTADFTASSTAGVAPFAVGFTDLSVGMITDWSWDFGDGTTSSARHPTHVFETPGNYLVTLTVANGGASTSVTLADPIVIQPPTLVADFGLAPGSGTAPLAVHFFDTSQGLPTSWLWDFGDGGLSSAEAPQHVYTSPGTYSVSLTVGDGFASDTTTLVGAVTVTAPDPPTAGFLTTPGSGVSPLFVTFTDQSTGGPTAWAWDFGDGATSTLQSPTHVYANVGTYDVMLTATNSSGSDTRVAVGEVLVTLPPAPVVDFTSDVQAGALPLVVQFTDLSTASATAWAWDFGDGESSSLRHPLHIYLQEGIFSVTLTATNVGGSSSMTRTGWIEVSAYRLGFLDGSFEEGVPNADPSAAWTPIAGDLLRVHPRRQSRDNAMPTQGAQWLEVSAIGSEAAVPPSTPWGVTTPATGAAGVAQEFRYGPDAPMLNLDAVFLRGGAAADAAANDFMSIELDDGTTTHSLYYRDSFSDFPRTSRVYGLPMTVAEAISVHLPTLFPGSDESTLLTLSILVGNGGDGEDPSRGYVDRVRLTQDESASVVMLGCGVNPAGSMAVRGLPRLGETVSFELDNPLGTQCPGTTLVTLYLSSAGQGTLPCGVSFPNYGMAGGAGELVIVPGASVVYSLPAPPWTGPGVPTIVNFAVPTTTTLLGLELYAQGLFVDATAACGVTFGLTEAARLTLGL